MWTDVTGADLETLARRLDRPVKKARFQPLSGSMNLLDVDGTHYLCGDGPIESASLVNLKDEAWRFRIGRGAWLRTKFRDCIKRFT